MNPGLLAPLGLAALAALLIPLLLHLARRTPQRRTEFAALRWLAARLRPRRRIRIEEPWLLLLRLLLVACVALLFARPVWTPRQAGTPWVLVHPAVAAADARARVECADCEWHWLAPGFPTLDARPADAHPPTASLLREADASLPGGTRVTVVVPRELDGLDAERPRLARPVTWTVLPGSPLPAPPTVASAPLALALQGAATAPGARYLRAAARANGWRVDETDAATPPSSTRLLFWLEARPPPPAVLAWARAGGTLWLARDAVAPLAMTRVAWRDAAGMAVATEAAFGRGRLLQWRHALAPEALPLLLEPAFPRGLAEVLVPPAPAAGRAPAEALRPRTGGARYLPPPRPLDEGLLALAIALFAAERLLATRRSRSPAS